MGLPAPAQRAIRYGILIIGYWKLLGAFARGVGERNILPYLEMLQHQLPSTAILHENFSREREVIVDEPTKEPRQEPEHKEPSKVINQRRWDLQDDKYDKCRIINRVSTESGNSSVGTELSVKAS
jgi:hypothetical protein